MSGFDRFRSFAERYVVERAAHFRVGFEQDDAWKAILDAKTIYGQIAAHAHTSQDAIDAQAMGNSAQNPVGQTGASGPPGNPGHLSPRAMATAQKPMTPNAFVGEPDFATENISLMTSIMKRLGKHPHSGK